MAKVSLHEVVNQRIRELARKRGFSIRRLAEFAGISGGYLSTVLRGTKSPTLRTLERVAEALEVSPFELFRAEPEKNPAKKP